MIWLTWRQFRVQAVTAAAALAAFAILLAATGPHLASLYTASGITGCHGFTCGTAVHTFLSRLAATTLYPVVYALGIVIILVAPAITGIFWGAPLIARELETRTYALAWTQSISRTQWLVVKLALTGLAAMAVTEALSLIYAWWADPIVSAIDLGGTGQLANPFAFGRFSAVTFATGGITPLGYAAFAFALGTAAGTLIRRAVPAMAVTLAIFAAAQLAMPLWVRPHLIPPDRTIAAIESTPLAFGNLTAVDVPGQPGAWILSSGAIDAAGHPVSALPAACEGSYGSKAPDPEQCLVSQGIREEAITYQPASRYWPLQEIETGIFLALALALAGFCFWRLGRRRT
ncbi:MAG: ABC transporter permease subunit [Streptosporangiaceae bacterium]